MPTYGERFRQSIRIAIKRRAGKASDANALADATFRTWQEMETQLAPVIGTRGVDVLFARALHMTSATFPWLDTPRDRKDNEDRPGSVKRRLADREPGVAEEASVALLATFVELLTKLIGENLTERLMKTAWAPGSPASKRESNS